MSRTLAIIKPDAVAAGHAGKIIAHLEREGFRVRALRMTRLSREQAGAFTPCTGSGRSTPSWWTSWFPGR